MGNLNRHHTEYEKQWQDAFDGAEMGPSADLWDKIDNQLTKQESGTYKKRFLFYRTVAAACLLCLIGLGIFTATHFYSASAPQQISGSQGKPAFSPKTEESSAMANQESPASEDDDKQKEQLPSLNNELPENNNGSARSAAPLASNETEKQTPSETNTAQTSIWSGKASSADMPANHNEAVANNPVPTTLAPNNLRKAVSLGWNSLLAAIDLPQSDNQLYKVPNPYAQQGEKSQEKPVFYAGVDLGSNYFDPNFQQGNGDMLMARSAMSEDVQNLSYFNSADRVQQSYMVPEAAPGAESTPKVSLSYGVDVGMNLSKHFSLQSGIDYGTFSTNTRTAASSPYSIAASDLETTNSEEFAVVSDNEFTNSFELLTVPLKVGYSLVMNKLEFILSSGMAANFFLNNQVTDDSGTMTALNAQADPSTVYKPVFYSAIFSGGVHYNFVGNYQLTLMPEYRFAVSDMTQNDYSYSSQPMQFGINLGVLYKFR